MPLPEVLFSPKNRQSTLIYDRNGTLLYETLNSNEGRKNFLPLSEFPPIFIKATILSEDSTFYENQGLDFFSIIRTSFVNFSAGRITGGASTITQQLVRNLLGRSSARNLTDKLIEAAFALRLTNHLSKDKILELYLNNIYYGNQAYGAETAAKRYFGRSLKLLDLAELTLLVGLPQSPTSYNPLIYLNRAKKRQQYVLSRLLSAGEITEAQVSEILNREYTFVSEPTNLKAPHFVNFVLNQLELAYGYEVVYEQGLKVYTTLDYNLIKLGNTIIANQIKELSEKNVNNAAILAIDVNSAQILAWIGSANFFDSSIAGQVDIITSKRQPGSTLKPFLYLLAFREGFNNSTILPDIKLKFPSKLGDYTPQNYDLKFRGPVRFREALANSLNIPAVSLLDKIGSSKFLQFLQSLGLKSLNKTANHYGLSLALGSGEVTLLELTSAYLILARLGQPVKPIYLLSVQDSTGQELLPNSKLVSEKNLFGTNGKELALLVIDILSDNLARAPSFGEFSSLDLPYPAAVKTGTSRNFRDNWTIGFTPTLLTSVWVGNSSGAAMQNSTGVTGAGPIWKNFMTIAPKENPTLSQNQILIPNFPLSSNLIKVETCKLSGALPTPFCPEIITESYLKSNFPTKPDDFYKLYDCPSNSSPKIYLNLPAEFVEWGKNQNLLAPESCKQIESHSI